MTTKAWLMWTAFLPGVLGLTGCTSLDTVAKAEGSGEQAVYKASFDELGTAMPGVITNAGLQYVSTDNDKRVFLATHGISFWGWGGECGHFFKNL